MSNVKRVQCQQFESFDHEVGERERERERGVQVGYTETQYKPECWKCRLVAVVLR
jgi:hypothetical protein